MLKVLPNDWSPDFSKPKPSKQREQNCGSCQFASKCYAERASKRNVVINILACRIKKGINPNESARLLLDMIRPNIVRLVSYARSRAANYTDMESMITDLESKVIETLLDENGYSIGGTAYLTEYLFGTNPRTGWVRKWILWDSSKQKRFFNKHSLVGTSRSEDSSERDRKAIMEFETSNSFETDHTDNDSIKKLLDIVDDGVTLNANEYRVISFCLTHANENNKSRLIDGTHTYLAHIMGVSRPRVTRLFATARAKIIEAARIYQIAL